MPYSSVKKKISCSKEDLINMVLDIEKYPEFVPWCLDSKVYKQKDIELIDTSMKWGDIPKNIDAVFSYGRDNNTYFFKGALFWKYNSR